jgi:hypothetical protein
MILGAVMGAASRVEAVRRTQQRTAAPASEREEARKRERRRPQSFADPLDPACQSAEAAPKEAFDLGNLDLGPLPEVKPRSPFRARPGRTAGSGGARAAAEPRFAAASPGPRQDFRQRFGNYASHAQAELATYQNLEAEEAVAAERESQRAAEAANNNTSPSKAAARAAAMKPETADIVVPFRAQMQGQRVPAGSRSTQALAERLASALAAVSVEEHSADASVTDEPTIGVELRRETATFHIPVSQARLPQGLAALTEATAAREAESTMAGRENEMLEAAAARERTEAGGDATAALSPETADEADAFMQTHEAGAFQPPLVLRRRAD